MINRTQGEDYNCKRKFLMDHQYNFDAKNSSKIIFFNKILYS